MAMENKRRIQKEVTWNYIFKEKWHYEDKVVFTKEMLIHVIGQFWYDLYFDENDKFIFTSDYIEGTAREVGKTYQIIVLMIYLMINDPLANFVLTRKYGAAAGSFYEMLNQVLNDLQDIFSIQFQIKYKEVIKGSPRKNKQGEYIRDKDENILYKKDKMKTIKEINNLKGKGASTLFSYGKTGDDKLAIFYNYNYDVTMNQIIFLRGADDADGSRGLSVNVGYVVFVLLEEYSQEVDKGKLDPETQMARYKSLKTSVKRYSAKVAQKYPEKFPEGIETSQVALANIWDPFHPMNEALVAAIPEEEWRAFVQADPENNCYMLKEVNGVKYLRGTTLLNFYLYPKGSRERKLKALELKEVLKSGTDYERAEMAGFTFEGFIKDDNPLQAFIYQVIDAPVMEFEEFAKEYEIDHAEFGTDPGLRDAWASVPAVLGFKKGKSYSKVNNHIFIDNIFVVDNRDRRKMKQQVIPNPMLKQMQLEFWFDMLRKINEVNPRLGSRLEVNMDMRATSIREDYNYEIFQNSNIDGRRLDAQCVSFPSDERHAFGLEQRPDILSTIARKMIFSPVAKAQILGALKTLEPSNNGMNMRQPNPRKGKIDMYDALCYAIVKMRWEV